MTKINVTDERYFPTLGVSAHPGDVVDDETGVVTPAKTKKDVVNDGSAPQ